MTNSLDSIFSSFSSPRIVWLTRRQATSLVVCIASLSTIAGQAATYADDTSAAANNNATPSAATPASGNANTGSTDNSNSKAPPIQAGVQMIELNLQVLRDVGLDIKNVLKAASSLYDEVTIQPVTIQTEPEVIGYGTVINIPVGFTPNGPAPQPSKKRVDMAMNQMRPIIQLMKQDVDDFESGRRKLDISDDERNDLKPLLEQWVTQVNQINNGLVNLETLTKSPPYDNNAIAKAASDVHKDSKEMEELRRKLYKALQKEGKKKKNA